MTPYRPGTLEPRPTVPSPPWSDGIEAVLFLQQVRLFQAEVALDVWRSPRFDLPALRAQPGLGPGTG